MKVTMICGYPASGKSTVTNQLLASSTPSLVLNRDTEGGSIADLLPKLESHLKSRVFTNVILDNLFPTVDSRKPFIDLCKKHAVAINCNLMDTSIEDAQFNAVQRAITLLGTFPNPEDIKKAKHPNVFPPTVLFKYKKDFQKPTVAEGFDTVETIPFVRKVDPSFTNKALLLDYDGTLRECVGGNGQYPVQESEIEIKPNRKLILDKFQSEGFRLLGISNQSGVHKGILTFEKASKLFEHTNKLLGVDIEYRFCPHQSAPISCYCRKPMAGAFIHFMMKYKLNPKECIFVGDMTTDKTMATRAGIQYVDQAEFFK